MNLLTINELSKKIGISGYELRLRVKNGTLPHFRVGNTKKKVLIDEDIFKELIVEESHRNMAVETNTDIMPNDSNNTVGYDKIKRIG